MRRGIHLKKFLEPQRLSNHDQAENKTGIVIWWKHRHADTHVAPLVERVKFTSLKRRTR